MSDFVPYDERQLCLRVAEGDENAFRELFNFYRPKLYTYILKLTQSTDLAEEAVHEVFIKIWMNREKLLNVENFNGYIYRIAHNNAYNGLRKKATYTLALAELEGSFEYQSDDPSQMLVKKDVEKFIAEAVERLTPQQKLIYKLNREQGKRHEEIALQLGITVNTSKKHMADAMQSIRRQIATTYGSRAVALYVIFQLF